MSASARATTPTRPTSCRSPGRPRSRARRANTTFSSAAFFPQQLATANYFGDAGLERPDLAGPDARAVPSNDGGAQPGGGPTRSAPTSDRDAAVLHARRRWRRGRSGRRPEHQRRSRGLLPTASSRSPRASPATRRPACNRCGSPGPAAQDDERPGPLEVGRPRQDPNDSTRWTGHPRPSRRRPRQPSGSSSRPPTVRAPWASTPRRVTATASPGPTSSTPRTSRCRPARPARARRTA